MTLREIRAALDKIDLSTPLLSSEPSPVANCLRIRNLNVFRARFLSLDSIPFFAKEKQLVKSSFLFQSVSDMLDHNVNQVQEMSRILESVRLGAEALKGALASILPAPDETTVIVKLPEAKDLEEVIGFLSTLQRALAANVINSKINGQVAVKSWQPEMTEPAITPMNKLNWLPSTTSRRKNTPTPGKSSAARRATPSWASFP
jgi:hypothetical protein